MNEKEYSPFTPGSPVPVELFVGRSSQIEEILRYVSQTLRGRQENVFLVGDRGIGKSSLASFIKYYVNTQENLLGVHIFLGRASTLEEMVHHVFEQIVKEARQHTWFEEVRQLFGRYIEQIGLFGISVTFTPPEEDLRKLVREFPYALANLVKKIQNQKKGLFIALDDINGLAEKKDFANWYKSFVDEVATHFSDFPVTMLLIGLPEKRDVLYRNQPSLTRIFRVVEIDRLSDEEVREFLKKSFDQAGMSVEPAAMEVMIRYSSGLPILMHEIGDAVFWYDTDGKVDHRDAMAGVLIAAEKVGGKYLDPKVYRTIRSERYRSILRKLGKIRLGRRFSKKGVEAQLSEEEKRVFHNFLRKMRDLGVIERDIEKGPGAYRFVNEIYPIYIWMESERVRRAA